MPNYFTEFKDGPSGPSYKVKDEEARSSISAITNVYSAKNLCPVYKNCKTATVDGVTFTVYSNGSIKINGTSTADIDFDIIPANTCSLKPGSYIINGGLPKPEGNTYYLMASVVSDVTWGEPLITGAIIYDGDSDSIAVSSMAGAGAYTLTMHIDSGVTISNKTIKPMIRDARITDPTFAPYAMPNRELTEILNDIQFVDKNDPSGMASGSLIRYIKIGSLKVAQLSIKFISDLATSDYVQIDDISYEQILNITNTVSAIGDSTGNRYRVQIRQGKLRVYSSTGTVKANDLILTEIIYV